MPYLGASVVVIHYEEALYQVYAPLPLAKEGTGEPLLRLAASIRLSRSTQSARLKILPISCCD